VAVGEEGGGRPVPSLKQLFLLVQIKRKYIWMEEKGKLDRIVHLQHGERILKKLVSSAYRRGTSCIKVR